MNFKFLIACFFSVLCIALLIKESTEIGHKNASYVPVIPYNDTFIKNFDFDRFDLATEQSEKLLLSELRGYFIDKSGKHKQLFCWPLSEVHGEENEIELTKLGDDFVDYLNRSFYDRLQTSSDPESKVVKKLRLFKLFVLDSIRSKHYYVYMDQFCVVVGYYFYIATLRKVFNHSKVYSLTEDRYDFFEIPLGHNSIQVDAYIQDGKLPAGQGCTAEHTEFGCLNRCFKENLRLANYLYDANETGSIYLHYDPRNGNVSAQEHESYCFERCKECL